jgi:hypothetical protein
MREPSTSSYLPDLPGVPIEILSQPFVRQLKPPCYQPGDQVGSWIVIRSADENGIQLRGLPSPYQVVNGGDYRVVEVRCSCGRETVVREFALTRGTSTRCRSCGIVQARARARERSQALKTALEVAAAKQAARQAAELAEAEAVQ